MTAFVALWRLLRSLPTLAYAAVGAVAVAGLLWAWHGHAVASAYAAGHRDTVNAAHFDSALIASVNTARRTANAHTDTVVRTVTRLARRVDTIALSVPETLRVAVPVVDTLVIEAGHLTKAVDSLQVAIGHERTTANLAISVRDLQVTQSRFVSSALTDSLTSARRRPRWRTVGAVALVAATGGYAWGRR